jgi:Tfp pilus assembly protein PilN
MTKRVDLLPQEYHVRKRLRERIVLWTGAVAMAALGVLLVAREQRTAGALLEAAVVPLRAQAAEIANQEDRLRAALPLLRALQEKEQTRLRSFENMKGLLREPSWSVVFSDLAESLSEKVWITELSLQKERKQTAQGDQPREETRLTLSGAGQSYSEVMDFVSRFSRSGCVRDFSLVSSSVPPRRGERMVVKFAASGVIK